jgi:outer membrane lipoprotein LolB
VRRAAGASPPRARTPWRLLASLAWLASLAAGCASTPPPVAGPLRSGRLALQVAAQGDAPGRAFTARFELIGNAQTGRLRLSSPIGPQLAEARWEPGYAVLDTGHGERPYADLTALSRDALGEPLPLQALPDWLDGRPWTGAPSMAAAQGFDQLGWSLDLSRRADGTLIARRAAPPEVTLRVRLDDAAGH